MRLRQSEVVEVLLLLRLAYLAASEEMSIPTKAIEHKKPAFILSRSDLQETSSPFSSPVLFLPPYGAVASRTSMVQRGSLTLAGEKIILDFGPPPKVNGIPLKPDSRGCFQTHTMKLANGQPYALAFPGMLPSRTPKGIELRMFLRCGIVRVGMIGTCSIGIYDDDLDGIYRLESDTVSVNTDFVFAPLLAHLATPKGVFTLASLREDGTEIRFQPVEGETATIAVTFKGKDLAVEVAIASEDTSFTTKAKGEEMIVLPGEYHLLYGLLFSQKAMRPVAGILPGTLSSLSAEAKKKGVIALGEPFRLVFEIRKTDRKVMIHPASFRLKGEHGEEYVGFRMGSPPPSVVWVSGKREVPLGQFEVG